MAERVVLASSNRGKLAEIQAMLADSGVELVSQGQLGISDADETGLTFIENALLKARHAAAASGLPALADDSGLVVPTLKGEPGVHSARYAGEHGNDAANIQRLLQRLTANGAEHTDQSRQAFFICVIAFLQHAEDPTPLICEGRWHGEILEQPRGDGGFGYDPVFLPRGLPLSAAELPAAEKNRISHRGLAISQLRQQWSR